ncbi:MAG: hypothetical protein JMN24_05945 [gamma proteobacterium endosymbiont of Lamellibrachia anaximandri]|nr:hypothetical protein [gamma proteobacterium endosymbiont of Lamellibrachia anaximandri]MBL3617780.1 hypothetical protein [gamma proteobacterium endosymbiont of Lamellibrachia anaximandri]
MAIYTNPCDYMIKIIFSDVGTIKRSGSGVANRIDRVAGSPMLEPAYSERDVMNSAIIGVIHALVQ